MHCNLLYPGFPPLSQTNPIPRSTDFRLPTLLPGWFHRTFCTLRRAEDRWGPNSAKPKQHPIWRSLPYHIGFLPLGMDHGPGKGIEIHSRSVRHEQPATQDDGTSLPDTCTQEPSLETSGQSTDCPGFGTGGTIRLARGGDTCGHVHVVHVPHPMPHMKPYAIRELVKFLKERGYESPDVS